MSELGHDRVNPSHRKPQPCRYFSSSGTCLHGENCQFLHERPIRKTPPGQTKFHRERPERQDMSGNGEQYMPVGFSIPNGTPDFQPHMHRPQPDMVAMHPGAPDPAKSFSPRPQVSISENQFVDQFATMTLNTPDMVKGHTPIRGRNPGATEFVPKSGTPGLNHSSSSPSFLSYSQAGQIGHHHPAVSSLSFSQVTQGASFRSVAPSVAESPGMSPQSSPMVGKREKSPTAAILPGNNTSTPVTQAVPVQENWGGTTYFYTQDEINSTHPGVVLPNFTVYPGVLPHVAHMKLKANMPSFFMPDEIKMDLLNKHGITLAQINTEQNPDIPQEVDNYHSLFPIEPPQTNPMHKSSTFGYMTSCYRGSNTKDGLTYCLRRIHGFHMVNTKCMAIIDLWKKIQHSNLVQLREVFTTKAFGDHSMVFVYDFHPAAETLMQHHFSNPTPSHLNGYSSPYNIDGTARPYSAGKGAAGPRQHAGLLPESQIWSYIVQLTSALRTIHAHGLACRVLDPTKIIITGKSRIRLNCVGIFDVLSFDANQTNPLAVMPHYQQEDLVALGKVVVALACNSLIGIQREHLQTSLDLITRNYSADLKNLILYLLSNQNRVRSVNDIMPMIGARFYTQLDAAQLRNDVLENELAKEVENGRLLRLICKLGVINERPEMNMDPAWAETGDRYMLKLFRDFLFHQVDENGAPWIDLAHIVQNLNKLDAGVPEKVCLMSRDEQSVLVVTYTELKQCFQSAFNELLNSGHSNHLS